MPSMLCVNMPLFLPMLTRFVKISDPPVLSLMLCSRLAVKRRKARGIVSSYIWTDPRSAQFRILDAETAAYRPASCPSAATSPTAACVLLPLQSFQGPLSLRCLINFLHFSLRELPSRRC